MEDLRSLHLKSTAGVNTKMEAIFLVSKVKKDICMTVIISNRFVTQFDKVDSIQKFRMKKKKNSLLNMTW